MDVLFFLKRRTNFIKKFYDDASNIFIEMQRKIEAGEEPYCAGDDDIGGPPFEREWKYAEESLDMLGRACNSMLSASLKLYFFEWEKELKITWRNDDEKRLYFKSGFVAGYRKLFEELLKINWTDSGVNFDVIEQVVLTRNQDQHPGRLSDLGAQHAAADRKKYPSPIFVSDTDRAILSDPIMSNIDWLLPSIYVSRDNLFHAIEQIDSFTEWLEPYFVAVRSGLFRHRRIEFLEK